jgi:hypothetical protein
VVFLAGADLTLPASVFFGDAGFLAVVAFTTTGFFLVGPVPVFVAGLATILEAGLVFWVCSHRDHEYYAFYTRYALLSQHQF